MSTTTATDAHIQCWMCNGKGQPLEKSAYTPRPLGPGDVEVAIEYCGICYSDIHTLDSGWGPTDYPCVVGHEIVGTVRAVGSGVSAHHVGDVVGVGAQVWSCQNLQKCPDCSTHNDQLCPQRVFTYNSRYPDSQKAYGGYADAVRVAEEFVFKVPTGMGKDVVAPLLCAGATVYRPLAKAGVKAGMRVGVVGIGGLGHLAVQFAAKMGAEVTAISHSQGKKAECKKLGASTFLNILDKDAVANAKQTLNVLLITSNHEKQPWDTYFAFLKNGGTCVLLAVPEEPVNLHAGSLIMRELTFTGSLIGSRKTIQEMLDFAAKHDVRPYIEVMPMSDVNKALQKVREGRPRYRIVLENDFAGKKNDQEDGNVGA